MEGAQAKLNDLDISLKYFVKSKEFLAFKIVIREGKNLIKLKKRRLFQKLMHK
jgi:hypothetical protein